MINFSINNLLENNTLFVWFYDSAVDADTIVQVSNATSPPLNLITLKRLPNHSLLIAETDSQYNLREKNSLKTTVVVVHSLIKIYHLLF